PAPGPDGTAPATPSAILLPSSSTIPSRYRTFAPSSRSASVSCARAEDSSSPVTLPCAIHANTPKGTSAHATNDPKTRRATRLRRSRRLPWLLPSSSVLRRHIDERPVVGADDVE